MPGPENHLQSAAVTLYGLMARRPQIYEKYTGHDQCFAAFRIKIDDNAGKIPPGHAVMLSKNLRTCPADAHRTMIRGIIYFIFLDFFYLCGRF